MAVTLPQLTETIDNKFVSTWYEIRAEAIDNILDATVVWAALKGAGCMTPQTGGRLITRTISYDYQTAVAVQKGTLLPMGEKETQTMARWTPRYIASHVQRSLVDDQQNAGEFQIKSYVAERLQSSRDGMEQKLEARAMAAVVTDESGNEIQGLKDIIPPYASAKTGTYGGIARPATYADSGNGVYVPATGNTFWGAKYLQVSNPENNLLEYMKKLYNSIHNNQVAPNLLVTTQDWFEIYETYGLDISQIIKDESTRLVDLGFEVLRFKGKPLIWTPNAKDGSNDTMRFLTTDFMEIVYDPSYWFEMTDFKSIPNQFERIAHIIATANIIATQLRRFGMLTEETIS